MQMQSISYREHVVPQLKPIPSADELVRIAIILQYNTYCTCEINNININNGNGFLY